MAPEHINCVFSVLDWWEGCYWHASPNDATYGHYVKLVAQKSLRPEQSTLHVIRRVASYYLSSTYAECVVATV